MRIDSQKFTKPSKQSTNKRRRRHTAGNTPAPQGLAEEDNARGDAQPSGTNFCIWARQSCLREPTQLLTRVHKGRHQNSKIRINKDAEGQNG